MDIARLIVWRNALMGEIERMRRDPKSAGDPVAMRRILRVEAEIEMIEDRIRESVGSSE